MKNFSKRDLRNHDLIEFRNGTKAIFIKEDNIEKGYNGDIFIAYTDNDDEDQLLMIGSYMPINRYNEDLKLGVSNDEFDIMKVYSTKIITTTIKLMMFQFEIDWTWERKDKTKKQIELEKLQEQINDNMDVAKQLQEQFNKLKNS